jgi:hypothetical protein
VKTKATRKHHRCTTPSTFHSFSFIPLHFSFPTSLFPYHPTQTRPKLRMEDVGPTSQSPSLSHSTTQPPSPPMQHRKKNKEYQLLEKEREGEVELKGTRWHEGHTHTEDEQHYHHLTLPSLPDIETDDSEFFDPTESMLTSRNGLGGRGGGGVYDITIHRLHTLF